jgi:hypothetical protein
MMQQVFMNLSYGGYVIRNLVDIGREPETASLAGYGMNVSHLSHFNGFYGIWQSG